VRANYYGSTYYSYNIGTTGDGDTPHHGGSIANQLDAGIGIASRTRVDWIVSKREGALL